MTYLAILRTPRILPLVVATTISRLPVGVNPLATVLFVHGLSGSFRSAGLVVGAMAVGTAVGQPILSRLVDARGNAIMISTASGQLVSVAGLLVAGHADAPLALLAVFALLNGGTLSPTSSVLRATWPKLLDGRPQLMAGAYAIDSILIQLSFLSGPLIVSVLAMLASPDVALAFAAAAALAGTAAFVLVAPSERRVLRRRNGPLGPLREPAIRTLVISQLPVGIAFGSITVILPGFADHEGHAGEAGLLLSLLSVASITGALVYGSRPRTRPVHEIHLRLAMFVPLGFLPMLAAWSMPSMALLVLPAGAVLSAFFATRNELAGVMAPAGSVTEAVTWPLTALIVGSAIGTSIAGAAIEGAGWRTAAAISVCASVVGAALVRSRQATLASRPATT